MSRLAILFVPILLLVLIPIATAEQTVKTIEVPIGYVAMPTAGGSPYISTLTIKPPDRIQEIISFELVGKGDFQASTGINAKVRKTGTAPIFDCTPATWTTPSIDTANYEVTFDCSALANQYDFTTGKIDAGFAVSKTAQNVYARARMTYYNQPKPILNIFGTEYVPEDDGTVFLQLLDSNKNPINDGSCEFTIYYPNETLKLMDSTPAYYLDNGMYFRDFIVPDETGVYMIHAYCYYAEERYIFFLPYNVSYDGQLYDGSTDDVEDVRETDCTMIQTENGQYQRFDFNDAEIGNINISSITSLDLIWSGTHEVYGYIQAWNFVNSSWDNIGASVPMTTDYDECYDTHAVTRKIATNIDDYVSGDEVRFRFRMNEAYKKMHTDEATLIFHNNGSVISDIRGSGELHVSDIKGALTNLTVVLENVSQNILVEAVWNFSNRSIDYTLLVGGTEYNSGEEGKLMVQFLKVTAGSGQPVNDGTCNATVRYPNETIFLNNVGLTYISGSNAIYTFDFTVPYTEGIYSIDAECVKGGIKAYSSGTFHVGEWANTLMDMNYTQQQILNYLIQINATTIRLENKCDQMNITLQQIRDFQVNELSANLSEILLYLEYINTTANRTYTYITGLVNLSAPEVWSYYNRTLTDYNQSYLISLILGLENLTASKVWSYYNRTLTFYPAQQDLTDYEYIRDLIWNASNRTLTDFDFTVDIDDSDIITFLTDMNITLTDNQAEILQEILGVNATATDIYNLLYGLSIGNVSVSANVNWTEGELVLYNASSQVQGLAEVLRYQAQNVQIVTTTDTCSDPNTLNHHVNTTNCIAEHCYTSEFDSKETCLYGCKNNICVPPPWMSIGIGLIIALIISVTVYWIWRRSG